MIPSSLFCLNEIELIENISSNIDFDFKQQANIKNRAKEYIGQIKLNDDFNIEQLLQMYDLSTEEGVALICLAESLSRTVDNYTAFDLILDKLSHKEWVHHFSDARNNMLRITTLGLSISSTWSDICSNHHFFGEVTSKYTKSSFISIMKQVILWLSTNFIIGENIDLAIKKARKSYGKYSLSFDLLGESSRNFEQADIYYQRYINAIAKLKDCSDSEKHMSVKLTSLYPRLEIAKLEIIERDFFPKLLDLVNQMADAEISITFDAEEARRLDIYIHILSLLIKNPECRHSNIGFVVQAYQKSSYQLVEYIIKLAQETDKKIPIRLVKGAYWDTEIQYAQMHGLEHYPVFTKKSYTDINYLCCAKIILDNIEYISPQFATHNAITVASIAEMAGHKEFELQKLFGMGNSLHDQLISNYKIRIYAPVGNIKDLLAYLMRRLLENGANASFARQVNQIDVNDMDISVAELKQHALESKVIAIPEKIFQNRENSIGYDMEYQENQENIHNEIHKFHNNIYRIGPIINGDALINKKRFTEHFSPANNSEKISEISAAAEENIKEALDSASNAFDKWGMKPVRERANILRNIANIMHENRYELYSLLIREAGKSIKDAIDEVREAIDFCRYYALQAEDLMANPKLLSSPTGEKNTLSMHPRGVFLCISPWNFPLAIFTGQIVAALVSGNSVIAKSAEQTSAIAFVAVQLMHKAGIPNDVLQLLTVSGSTIGKYVTPHPSIAGVVFTGSNNTAKVINQTLAARNGGIIPIIAETGGQNAMIVDSSALLEQVTDDVLKSSFYSAGQRCSALRVLYIQEEIYDELLAMIKGAIETLHIGNTSDFSNDIGPVIDKPAHELLSQHVENMNSKKFKIHHHSMKNNSPDSLFFYPHIIEINSINDVNDEKFGPILHIVKYKNQEINKIIDEINNYGYGLTFGVHTRIESRIEFLSSRLKVGNIYANRAMTGAQVESQPFGGENKSGTGFKAGGPHYLLKFMVERTISINTAAIGGNIELLRD